MSLSKHVLVIFLFVTLQTFAQEREPLLISDFESGTWIGWNPQGEAFDTIPSYGTLSGQQTVSGYEGEWLVNTFFGGDSTVGVLTSDTFLIERTYINFRMGGGSNGGCRVELWVNGEMVRSAYPDVSEELLKWSCMDVTAFEGSKAVLRIVDNEQGGWGHICVDHFEMADNNVIGGFEGTYGGWISTGNAFGDAPATGTFEGQNIVTGFNGNDLVNTYLGGDGAIGTLHSPSFKIEHPYINFRLGGGFDASLLHVDLVVEGCIVRSAAPVEWIERPNDAFQERLFSRTWDVTPFIGDSAYIVITDSSTEGWGHINADDFIQTDYRASFLENDYTVRLSADGAYLQVPTQNWNPYVNVHVRDDQGNSITTSRIRLARDGVDRYIPIYIGARTGLPIDVVAGMNYTNSVYEEALYISEEPDMETQSDIYRPLYHHAPAYGWASDPNGLVYHNGLYHLFYQHYPYDPHWNSMHWGHAVSSDLLHWEQQPIALFPDEYGMMYSGSIIVDKDNTAGFGTNAFVAVYTSTFPTQSQSIAYSIDEGKTWHKYGAPVLVGNGDFRDPKVFWYDAWNCWMMILANGFQVETYQSSNLREWQRTLGWGGHVGAHDGTWECPDLVQIPIEGTNESRWVMLVSVSGGAVNGGSGTQYFIGDFTGDNFLLQTDGSPRWVDYGKDNYAGITWTGKHDAQGRPLFIGWMNNWDYANDTPMPWSPFRGQHTFPRALSLVNTPDGLKLKSEPIAELDMLRSGNTYSPLLGEISTQWQSDDVLQMAHGAYILELDLASEKHSWKMTLANDQNEFMAFGYNANTNEVYLDRKNSGIKDIGTNFANSNHVAILHPNENANHALLLVDHSSVELFINGGRLVFSDLVFPITPYDRLILSPEGSALYVSQLQVTKIESYCETKNNESRQLSDGAARKIIKNGQILLLRSGAIFNVLGLKYK